MRVRKIELRLECFNDCLVLTDFDTVVRCDCVHMISIGREHLDNFVSRTSVARLASTLRTRYSRLVRSASATSTLVPYGIDFLVSKALQCVQSFQLLIASGSPLEACKRIALRFQIISLLLINHYV